MPKALPPQTPTRRSQRFQPTATPVKSINQKAILECAWASKPIYVRPSDSEIDLLPEEQEEVNNESPSSDDDDDTEIDKKEALETFFYDAFTMKRKVASLSASGGRRGAVKLMQRTYHVGDTVLIETESIYVVKRPPSVGVIVAMWQIGRSAEEAADPNKMRVRIHWFLRPKEMASIRAKRQHEENEIYYSLSTTVVIAPGAILSPCTVSSSLQPITIKRLLWVYVPVMPSKKRQNLSKDTSVAGEHDNSSDDDKDKDAEEPDARFYCRLAVDSRRGLFYEFTWERHRKDALSRAKPPINNSGPSIIHLDRNWALGNSWIVEEVSEGSSDAKTKKNVKARRVKNDDASQQEETEVDDSENDERTESESDGEGEDAEYDTMAEPRTPSRKRQRKEAKTPRNPKRNKTLAQPTPHSKAALISRQKASSSPRKRKIEPSFGISFSSQSLTFKTSMAHLPKDPWLRAMHALHVGSRPDSLPCRGEEFHKVLRCVSELLEEGSGGCVYISGVPGTGKTATVHTVVKELKRMAENNEINPFSYVEINGLKIAEPAAAYNLLWEGVSGHDAEKDGHLHIGAKESLKALTRHFASGNRGPGGHACVVLMDELDQLVTPKQDVVYNFFNWPTLVGSKLVVIAVANTMDLPERVMTGRVRSRLGMVRINFQPYSREQLEKIVEARLASAREDLDKNPSQMVIAADAIKLAAMTVSRITGDARRVLDICRRAVELVQATRDTVKAPQIREVVQLMQNSPTAAFLRDLSFHERLMLASLVTCAKREGVDEIRWSEVQYQHLNFIHALSSEDDPTRRPTPAELLLVLDSLVSSRAVVVEEGVIVARKPDGERRLLLNIELNEVRRVLSDIGGQRWKNLLMSD
ncbi:P-loop containing nucleoside triphosphate hydrolase protein [Phlegmacium glaucopus]|nr:P-loop containing nucleoside triphosphate hydrolase protein [Phlegmacium glaucopus]